MPDQPPTPKLTTTLTISLAQHLHGTSVLPTLERNWSKAATPDQRARFEPRHFDLDPTDEPDPERGVPALKRALQGTKWDGVLIGWCLRGSKEYTPVFERVVGVVVGEVVRRRVEGSQGGEDGGMRVMFCEGPDDLVNATLRTFGDS
ncbi:uncharacterized protein HMPREF1541_01497 [Cyphellophora europaea CBS 101466]|uniref:Uncharacterized protein n=1 Tax=Cyphellophora europaea (strain CBS 101466) TaxID=1220924 RepID=W2S2R7_CYPE1|nr:uncharacterized protein HMPREF1541_01497 [Cyphellophora europaea CBS 101466]ETN42343.1 hypothetical protein HMPREF1541_01497 [Cyphellophora europaea CBS 101466]